MDEGVVVLGIIGFVICSIIGGCTAETYNDRLLKEKAIENSLQQCPQIGNTQYLWQKECKVPKTSN